MSTAMHCFISAMVLARLRTAFAVTPTNVFWLLPLYQYNYCKLARKIKKAVSSVLKKHYLLLQCVINTMVSFYGLRYSVIDNHMYNTVIPLLLHSSHNALYVLACSYSIDVLTILIATKPGHSLPHSRRTAVRHLFLKTSVQQLK